VQDPFSQPLKRILSVAIARSAGSNAGEKNLNSRGKKLVKIAQTKCRAAMD
jgi:hypothetical protein